MENGGSRARNFLIWNFPWTIPFCAAKKLRWGDWSTTGRLVSENHDSHRFRLSTEESTEIKIHATYLGINQRRLPTNREESGINQTQSLKWISYDCCAAGSSSAPSACAAAAERIVCHGGTCPHRERTKSATTTEKHTHCGTAFQFVFLSDTLLIGTAIDFSEPFRLLYTHISTAVLLTVSSATPRRTSEQFPWAVPEWHHNHVNLVPLSKYNRYGSCYLTLPRLWNSALRRNSAVILRVYHFWY